MARAKQKVWEITILYKSGVEKTFKAIDFEIINGRYSWTAAPGEKHYPLFLGVDNVAAVWQREI